MKRQLQKWGLMTLFAVNLAFLGTQGYLKWIKPSQKSSERSLCAVEPVCAHLNMTPRQKEKWQEIKSRFKTQADPLSRELNRHRIDLMHALSKGAPDDARVLFHMAKIDSLQSKVQVEVIHYFHAMKEVLDDSQEKLFFEEITRCCTARCQKIKSSDSTPLCERSQNEIH